MTGDADTVDMDRVARLCADDWGLWRTLTQNLEKVGRTRERLPTGER